MRYIDILIAFETEINVINTITDKPKTDDSLYWLNQAVSKFVKLRFNGDLVHKTGFELTEKRRTDILNLITTKIYDIPGVLISTNYNTYSFNYPEDFLYELNEEVEIKCALYEGNTKLTQHVNDNYYKMNTCTFECTRDNYMYRINNSLTDFHYRYHRARPIRIRTKNGIDLLTDGKYDISRYELTYIKTPTEITLDSPTAEYTDFNDSVMYEIVKMAAQMYLENKKSERYLTISNEVLTQE